MTRFSTILLAASLALAVTPAFAQNQGKMQGADIPGMNMQGMGNMMGMHMMTVTVIAINSKTGLVDCTAGNLALKLHFPPASLAGVKAGDKLMVHLGFSKS